MRSTSAILPFMLVTSVTVATAIAQIPTLMAYANTSSVSASGNHGNMYAQQSVKLPNGLVLTGKDNLKTYDGIKFNFQVGLNNHTEIVSQQHIQTRYGVATLDKTVMTSPASSQTKQTWYSYDVLLSAPQSLTGAYGPFQIHAEYPKGKDQFAKQVLLKMVKNWRIPALDKTPNRG